MQKPPSSSKASLECIQKQVDIISQLVSLLNLLIAISIGHATSREIRSEETPVPDLVTKVIPMMLQAVGSSSITLIKLSNEPGFQTRDCYSIIRSIVETSVNICYIIAEGPSAADRALRHARQKSYMDLQRELNIGETIISLRFSSIPDPAEIEDLEKDINGFMSQSGREKGWVDLSIDKRIEVVGEKLGKPEVTDLSFARFMIYRHSSEILHGTFFSTIYFFGASSPNNKPASPEELIENITQQHIMILMANIASLSAVIESFHKAYGFKSIVEKLNVITSPLNDIPYFKN